MIAFVLAGVLVEMLAGVVAVEGEVVDRVAAVVENTVVTERELEEKARLGMSALQDINDESTRDKRRKEILHQTLEEIIADQLIDTELGKVRDKLGVTDKQVDDTLAQTARMNNMSMDQLTQALYNQGYTVAEFKKTLRKQLERSQYLQFRMQGKTGFSEKDVISRCQELRAGKDNEVSVHARHVLVKVAPDASPTDVAKARARIDTLYAQAKNGGDFGALADKESEDKGASGGDLGYFQRGDMVPQFEAVAFAMKIGELSKPIRTRFGFHIIKVEDRKKVQAAGCNDEAVKAQISQELYSREMERQLKLWVDELRRKAFVDVKI